MPDTPQWISGQLAFIWKHAEIADLGSFLLHSGMWVLNMAQGYSNALREVTKHEGAWGEELGDSPGLPLQVLREAQFCWGCGCIGGQPCLCCDASRPEPVLPASCCTQTKAQSSDPEHKTAALGTKPLDEQHRRELRLFPGPADHKTLHLNAVRAGWTI